MKSYLLLLSVAVGFVTIGCSSEEKILRDPAQHYGGQAFPDNSGAQLALRFQQFKQTKIIRFSINDRGSQGIC